MQAVYTDQANCDRVLEDWMILDGNTEFKIYDATVTKTSFRIIFGHYVGLSNF